MKNLLLFPVLCLLLVFAGCGNSGKSLELASVSADQLTPFRDAVYFSSYTDLWKTDGTKDGTVQVTKINSKITLKELTVVGNLLYFSADDGKNGECLWVTDGTEAGTQPVRTAAGAILPRPEGLTVFKNKLFCSVADDAFGNEPWVCGGTPETTYMLKNIREEVDYDKGSYPNKLTVCGNLLFFSANDGKAEYGLNQQLWQTDGTPEGTQKTDSANQQIETSPYYLTCAGQQLLFLSDSSVEHTGLWKTTGTAGSLALIKKFKTGMTNEFSQAATSLSGTFYLMLAAGDDFTVPSEKAGVVIPMKPAELWKSDGTAEGTQLVTTIDSAYGSNRIYSLNGKLYFLGGYEYGSRLWQSDGTKEGTFPLTLFHYNEHQYPFGLMEQDGKVYYFIKNKKTEELSLAVTDGKTNSMLIENFYEGAGVNGYQCIYKDKIYFAAYRSLRVLPFNNFP